MWHHDQPVDGILHVKINREDRPVNALSRSALEELAYLLDHIRSQSDISGVIFSSGKPGNFIAGADVTELKDLTSKQAAKEISVFGQRVFQQLEDFPVPTVALISGSCLGGGLEFALACRYRIADDSPKTLLAVPEVKLGLIPGWGGTVRLPRLIGVMNALPMILTGKMLNGFQARSKGLVHDAVPHEALELVGRKILAHCQQFKSPTALFRKRKRPLFQRIVDQVGPVRNFVLGQAEKQVLSKTHGHYPAPIAAIQCLRDGLATSRTNAFEIEAEAISGLSESPVTTELMRLFFLQEDCKKPPESLNVSVEPQSIQQAAVIGAGAMGAGIALLMAKKGVWTRLKDIKPEFVSNGMKIIHDLVSGDVKRRRTTKIEAMQALDHLSPTTDYRGIKNADIVIEAVIEEPEIKRQVFTELAAATGPKTVLATNTSSLLVTEIASGIPHPERIVGLHFFNPPHQMPLVEVITTDQSSPEALATTLALVKRIGKTPVVVSDCAGFLVNRLLAPYMNEAGFLLAEVEDAMEIEKAAIDFGFPMGPLKLTDLVGINVAAHVAENMHAAYGDRMEPAPLWGALKELASENKKGQFRLVKKKKKKRFLNSAVSRAVKNLGSSPGVNLSREKIIQRLVFPVINEAARCLEEGVVQSADEIDLAMVFGTGFAPFRGGPMNYAETIGISKVVEVLDELAETAPRFTPCDALREFAKREHGFHTKPKQDLESVSH